ncbi:hypothetical protein TYRP_007511 [Tyrophagus putrescentiae]|nr:hypothetical protein TYRP_007511 [Tyrophagus putrescentiae]
MGLFDIFKKDGKSKHKQRRQKSNKAKGGQQGKQQTNQPPQEQQQPQQQSQAPPSSSRSPTSRLGPSPVHHSPTSHAPTAQTNGTSATAGATTRHAHKSPARSVQSFDLERELATPHLEPSSPVTSVYQKTYDCVAFVLHCPSHGKVAVARSPTEAIWLPYVQKHQKMSWYDSAKEGAMQVLAEGSASRFEAFRRKAPFDQLLLLEVARVQMPSTNKFVARYIFYVRLNVPATAAETESGQPTSAATETTASKAGFKCCTDTARLQWLAIDFVSQGFIRNCWGPELVELARLVMEATRLQEQSVEQLFEILPRLDGPVQMHDTYTESLRKIKTNKNDIERLFSDYLDHCYPSFYMTYDSFRHYLSRNGFEKNETRLKRFFRAFNRAANGYLSFNELLLGADLHGARDAARREDFALIVADMNVDKHGRVVLNEGQIQRKAAEAMACFRTKPAEGGEEGAPAVVTFSSFLQGVGSHAFRGTSNLCRSRCNVFAKVNRRIAARAVKMNASVAKGRLARLVTRKGYQGSCQGCRAKKYRVAAHLAVVGVDGYLLLASSEDGQSVAFEELQPPAQSPGAATAEESGTSSSEQSVANFAAEPRSDIISDALKLMALIRLYNESKPRAGAGLGKPMHGLMTEQEDRESLVRLLRAIASEIIPLLASEPRCKPVTSPVYIIGDVHGNLEASI